MKKKLLAFAAVLFLLISCTPRQEADLIIYNAHIYTVDSAFSVQQSMARGSLRLTKPWQTPNTVKCVLGRQTPGANVRCQEGNNPDRQLRSQMIC